MLSIKLNINDFYLYPVLFFFLFGPKLLGIIDPAIIISLLIFMFSLKKIKLTFCRRNIVQIIILMSIILYSFFTQFINNTYDLELLGRYIRSLISYLGIICLLDNKNINGIKIRSILINILLFHAVFVVISSFNLEIQNYFKYFTSFTKTAKLYRSTGLVGGFDIAGLLCIVGYLLVQYSNIRIHYPLIKKIIFITAGLLTSRFTMVIFFILILLEILKSNINKFVKVILIIGIVLISLPFINFAFETMNIHINLLDNLNSDFNIFNDLTSNLTGAYAESDLVNTIKDHYNFAVLSPTQLFFGTGHIYGGDPGYTQLLYSLGIIGLVLTLIWYGCYLKKYNKLIRWIIFITLFLNFKNSYFFTGTIFELSIITVESILKDKNNLILDIAKTELFSDSKIKSNKL